MNPIIPADTASGVLDVSQEKAIQPIVPLDTTIGDFKSLINPAQEFLSAPETITYAGSGLVFVNNYRVGDVIDAGELQYAQEYRQAIIKAEHELQNHFANPITINLSFKLQTIPDRDTQGNYTVSAENSRDSVKVSYNEAQAGAASARNYQRSAGGRKLAGNCGPKRRNKDCQLLAAYSSAGDVRTFASNGANAGPYQHRSY